MAVKTAVQAAADRALKGNDDDAKQQDEFDVSSLIEDTERLALIEENERLSRELAELKAKTTATVRKASTYQPGEPIPKHHGVFTVELWSKRDERTKRNSERLYHAELVSLDESDAMRQALMEYCDKNGYSSPPDLIRKVHASEHTIRERELRIAFSKWRRANNLREERGENLLPLPPALKQFEDQLTDIEQLAN